MDDPVATTELATLGDRVRNLERTVKALLKVLERADALTRAERAVLLRTLTPACVDDAEDPVTPAQAMTPGAPYRSSGRAATQIGDLCVACGALLDVDVPELKRADGARICTLCYARRR